MVDEPVLQTPNAKLARQIVEALREANLLTETRELDALRKIQSGKASESDWTIWAEDLVNREEEAPNEP